MSVASVADLRAQMAAIEAQRIAIEKQIAEAQKEERSAAIAKIKALMAEYGLTVADLGARAPSTPAARGPKAGGKVAPKYRHPGTGETWTGRGLQPKWLKAELAQGKKLSDFTI